MQGVVMTGVFSAFCWLLFQFSLSRDRSRYRNCYLLFLALLSLVPFILNLAGDYGNYVFALMAQAFLLFLLIVPFFLIHNGIVMIRKEGRHIAHLLSLGLGIVILIGEIATIFAVLAFYIPYGPEASYALSRAPSFIAGVLISVSVIYGSMAFLIFMIYTIFLQIIPRKRDFDYVIIHGAGLLDGERVSKLLQDRLDKAIQIYRKDPTPPKLIPSGGKGSDETISEAEAMKRYLLQKGIPEEDILPEDQSKTTYENLKFSKQILDSMEGRKYAALVTSNYHVYRALRYCRKIGLKCTGVGSHVAFYFWPSALIREFIAIHTEKKHAVTFAAGWLLCMLAVILVFWVSK